VAGWAAKTQLTVDLFVCADVWLVDSVLFFFFFPFPLIIDWVHGLVCLFQPVEIGFYFLFFIFWDVFVSTSGLSVCRSGLEITIDLMTSGMRVPLFRRTDLLE
jgi:hypothetical protein